MFPMEAIKSTNGELITLLKGCWKRLRMLIAQPEGDWKLLSMLITPLKGCLK